jgi:hypothetical protein
MRDGEEEAQLWRASLALVDIFRYSPIAATNPFKTRSANHCPQVTKQMKRPRI